jgi:hypothetical protein
VPPRCDVSDFFLVFFRFLCLEGVGEISLNPRKCKHILSVKSWPAGLKLQRFIPLGPKGGWAPVGVLVSHSVYWNWFFGRCIGAKNVSFLGIQKYLFGPHWLPGETKRSISSSNSWILGPRAVRFGANPPPPTRQAGEPVHCVLPLRVPISEAPGGGGSKQ